MRVLLIESQPEDVVFLKDVLAEIGEGRYWNHWVELEVVAAHSWNDASTILAHQPIDIILLNLEAFPHAQRDAPHIPIILLVGETEQMLALRLVRDGAQDFLVKKQIDCVPLAHSMRTAMERHRLLSAARAGSTHDTLTGLPNRAGFVTAANRDRRLAEKLNLRLLLLVAEIPPARDEHQRDLALAAAADHLRHAATPADLLARISSNRFGIFIFDSHAESLESAHTRIQGVLRSHHIQLGAAVFSPSHPETLDALLQQAVLNLQPHAQATHS